MTVFQKLGSLVPSKSFERNRKAARSCMDATFLKDIEVFFEQLPESKSLSLSCYQECSKCFHKLSQNHHHLEKGNSKERWDGCKEAKVKEAERRKKNTVSEGRHSVVSYTAKVNMGKSWNPIILSLSWFNRQVTTAEWLNPGLKWNVFVLQL